MVILFGSGAELTAWRWVAAVVPGLVAVAGVIIGLRRPTSRALFTLVIAVAAADLVLFAAVRAVPDLMPSTRVPTRVVT